MEKVDYFVADCSNVKLEMVNLKSDFLPIFVEFCHAQIAASVLGIAADANTAANANRLLVVAILLQ